MARPGRKRKQTYREPNGRPQRPTTQQRLNELNEQESRKVKTVVLMQPHRRPAKDPEAKELEQFSALERLCKARNVDSALLDAGLKYARLVSSWKAAWRIPGDPPPEEGKGTGEGPSEATVQNWKRQIDKVEAALTRAGCVIRFATQRLVLDKRDPRDRMEELDALSGLMVVAVELGMPKPDHPFR